jgi:zinc transporter
MKLHHAMVLDGKGGSREATPAEMDSGQASSGTLWLDMDHEDPGCRAWLLADPGVDEVSTEALLVESPRPRSLSIGGEHLLVMLRAVNLSPGEDEEDMVTLRLWIEDKRVISFRHRRVGAIEQVRAELLYGQGPLNSSELLYDLIDHLLDRIGQVVEDLEDQVDELEEMVLTAENREVRTKLSEVRRKSISLRRYLAPQRESLGRLHAERVPWLNDLTRARLRDAADRITRYLEGLDAARERAAVTYEELSNRLAEHMNNTMYRLSVVAAIFLPLGLLTGLLGINVGGMPGVDSPFAFAAVSILLVVLGVLGWLFFRRNRLI